MSELATVRPRATDTHLPESERPMLAQNLANNLGHGLPAVQPGTRPALGGRAAQRAAHGEALPERDSAHPGPRGLRAKRARPRARTGTRRWRPSSAQSPLAARPIRPRRRPAGAGGRVNVSPAHPCGAVGWFCGCHALPQHARALPVPVVPAVPASARLRGAQTVQHQRQRRHAARHVSNSEPACTGTSLWPGIRSGSRCHARHGLVPYVTGASSSPRPE